MKPVRRLGDTVWINFYQISARGPLIPSIRLRPCILFVGLYSPSLANTSAGVSPPSTVIALVVTLIQQSREHNLLDRPRYKEEAVPNVELADILGTTRRH